MYNTWERRLQVQDLMENYVATINTQTSTPSKPAPLVRSSGKDWEIIDQVTGKITLEPWRANTAIFPKTGKA